MHLGRTPFLATQVQGDTAWVSLLYVPRERRRHGLGRAMVERWLRTIPPDVRRVRLLAAGLDADSEGESPVGFWRKLGFELERGDQTENEAFTGFMVRPIARPQQCGRVQPKSSPDAGGLEGFPAV